MHTVIRLDSLPEDKRAEALRVGKPQGPHRVEIETSDLARMLKRPISPETIQPAKWPAWAVAMAAMKSDTDKGLGDTAEFIFGKFGGTVFKAAVKKLGANCGCGERKENWNKQFPYSNPVQ